MEFDTAARGTCQINSNAEPSMSNAVNSKTLIRTNMAERPTIRPRLFQRNFRFLQLLNQYSPNAPSGSRRTEKRIKSKVRKLAKRDNFQDGMPKEAAISHANAEDATTIIIPPALRIITDLCDTSFRSFSFIIPSFLYSAVSSFQGEHTKYEVSCAKDYDENTDVYFVFDGYFFLRRLCHYFSQP
jgi:hypothetical protein